LGLALAAWIAKRHQTEIEVMSRPDVGSTFGFALTVALDMQRESVSIAGREHFSEYECPI